MNLNPTIKSKWVSGKGRILYTDSSVKIGLAWIPAIADALLWIGFIAYVATAEEAVSSLVIGMILLFAAIGCFALMMYLFEQKKWRFITTEYRNWKRAPATFEEKYLGTEEYQTVLFEHVFHNVEVENDLWELNRELDEKQRLQNRLARGNPQVVKDVLARTRETNKALTEAINEIDKINRV